MTGPKCMTFFSNLNGITMGLVLVYVTVSGQETLAWLKSGDRGDRWIMEQVFINETREYKTWRPVFLLSKNYWERLLKFIHLIVYNLTLSTGIAIAPTLSSELGEAVALPAALRLFLTPSSMQDVVAENQAREENATKQQQELQCTPTLSTQHEVTHTKTHNALRVTLEVKMGRSWFSDKAIDDILFTNGSCAQETRLFHVSTTNGFYQIDNEPPTDNWFNQFSFLARRTTGNLKEQMFFVYGDKSKTTDNWNGYENILRTYFGKSAFPVDFFYEYTGSLNQSRPVFAVKRNGQAQQIVLAMGEYEGCCKETDVLSINVQVIEDHTCFPGWISSGSSGCLRFYVNDKRTWGGARAECRRIGGDLASIRDSNTLSDISKILETITSARAPFHVGMCNTVTNVTQDLTWVDGKTVQSSLWKSGYPKTGDKPLCAGLTEVYQGLVLHACSLRTGFICQRDSGSTTSSAQISPIESAEEIRGIRRDIWYKPIITQGLATIRFNYVYSSPPQGATWGRDFETSQEVSEDHGQLITSYFQPPSSGLYGFLVSCDDECELWISGYQEPRMPMEVAFDGVERMLTQIQKWDGYNESAG
ncbi:predicted protein [Nematostella vectensis]|uniref:C-type lectin domain-containing protein n=1 Tax=Nematostella vectensis TaxID=45351 RepID=A7T0S4_NEMVE|nr:predicted protein [Nematostella vectensis]|eukprot:XP_001622542.1 predicted protein [Nematostella vectensis]